MEAKRKPVTGFTPIEVIPSVRFTPLTEKDQVNDLNRLLETLERKSYVELRVPEGLRSKLRSLFLVKREGINPNGPKPSSLKRGFYVHLPPGHNYDEAFSLTLVGLAPDGQPKAVGYRDYKIFTRPQVANGDMGVNKLQFGQVNSLPPELQEALALCDQQYPGTFINGIEIVKEFRSAGLAKFLIATAAGLLQKKGIQKIELSSDKTKMIDLVRKIYASLRGPAHPAESDLHLSHLNSQAVEKIVSAFLK